VLKGMEQLELHDGQLTGVSILAAKGSHPGDGPGGFAVCNMCGEERFASHSTGHATGFAICNMCGEERAAFVARVDICGSMKELVVPDRRCLHFDMFHVSC